MPHPIIAEERKKFIDSIDDTLEAYEYRNQEPNTVGRMRYEENKAKALSSFSASNARVYEAAYKQGVEDCKIDYDIK
jgi:hypothetical protein